MQWFKVCVGNYFFAPNRQVNWILQSKNPEEIVIQHVQKPVTQHVQKPVIQHVQKPVIQHVQKPVIQHVQKPVNQHVQKPVIQHVQKPVTQHVQKPVIQHVQSSSMYRNQSPNMYRNQSSSMYSHPACTETSHPACTVTQHVQKPVIQHVQKPVTQHVQKPVIQHIQELQHSAHWLWVVFGIETLCLGSFWHAQTFFCIFVNFDFHVREWLSDGNSMRWPLVVFFRLDSRFYWVCKVLPGFHFASLRHWLHSGNHFTEAVTSPRHSLHWSFHWGIRFIQVFALLRHRPSIAGCSPHQLSIHCRM